MATAAGRALRLECMFAAAAGGDLASRRRVAAQQSVRCATVRYLKGALAVNAQPDQPRLPPRQTHSHLVDQRARCAA